jgi:membrane protease YdiL (CAAX protease family)
MSNKNKLTQKDSVIIYIIGFFIMLLGSLVLTTIVDSTTNLYTYLAFIIPQIGYIVAIFAYTHNKDIEFSFNFKENFKINKYKYILAVFFGAGIFFAALLLNTYLEKLYDLLKITSSVTIPTFNTGWDYVLSFIFICLLPPIGEELMFRKNMGDGFSKLGTINAVLLCGALFSLSHLNIVQTIYQFILGCLLAIIYLKTKDIVITIIIHLTNNVLALFLSVLITPTVWENIYVIYICFVVGILIASASLYFIFKDTAKIIKKQEKLSYYTILLIITMIVLWLICAFI